MRFGVRGSATCTCRRWEPPPREAKFAQQRLAQSKLSRLCRLHADSQICSWVAQADEAGSAQTDRDHVRRGSTVALPSFADCRCTPRLRLSSRGDREHEAHATTRADALGLRARKESHLSLFNNPVEESTKEGDGQTMIEPKRAYEPCRSPKLRPILESIT